MNRRVRLPARRRLSVPLPPLAVLSRCLAGLLLFLAGLSLPDAAAQATLRVRIVEDARPTPVRAKLTDERGHATPLPEQAVGVMYGVWDHADGFSFQPDSSFYVDGYFDVVLDPGEYVLELSKGNEFIPVVDTLYISEAVDRTYTMARWVDASALGWYSADGHVHIRRSPREDPLLRTWIAAEDVRVGNMLRMGDFWATYYGQYAFGEAGAYLDDGFMLVSGQEDPRTPELGHVVGIGASKPVRFGDQYYLYDLVLDSIRAMGGAAGYAHQAESFHGYRGLTLDGLREKVDVLELVQFCVPGGPLITDHYYFLLDLGFPVTAIAGSDFPWCGKPHDGSDRIPHEPAARIGNARFYTYVDGPLTYRSWLTGVRSGRTFASSGPILLLEVNGQLPGDRLALQPGDSLRIKAVAYGHERAMPLEHVEIVAHGEVIGRADAGGAGQSVERIEVELAVRPEHGMWIAARASAGAMHVAHTTPVYVSLDGDGFHRRTGAAPLLDRAEAYLAELEAALGMPAEGVEHHAWRYRDALEERIEAARAVVAELRRRSQLER